MHKVLKHQLQQPGKIAVRCNVLVPATTKVWQLDPYFQRTACLLRLATKEAHMVHLRKLWHHQQHNHNQVDQQMWELVVCDVGRHQKPAIRREEHAQSSG